MRNVLVKDLGLIDYKEAWDYQEKLFAEIIEKKIANRTLAPEKHFEITNLLLFCEHPHVYTLGKTGKEEHLLINEEQLKQKHAVYYKINRGGDITYHGPGQLVGYPILDLDQFFTDIHKYLRYLEEAIILTLKEYGIESSRSEGETGVWIDPLNKQKARKICAMGVRSSRWVTMHGFALNVNNDLSFFNNIIPCGIPDKAVTSMEKELGQMVNLKEVQQKVLSHLKELFEMTLVAK